jgi:predicted nucleotidyltransferase
MMIEALPAELQRILSEYRRLLHARFGERLVAVSLFGSRARGDAEEESDADVSVVVRGLREDERGAAIDLAFEAWHRVNREGPLLSPLVWSEAERDARRRAERRIALDIDTEGIAL